MYLMYVDESGDSGLINSPSRFFVLSGLVVHELRWKSVAEELLRFRKAMRKKFGLLLREEIHAASLINKPQKLIRIPRQDRLAILRHYADMLASIPDISVINIAVNKQGKALNYDVFDLAWKALFQRMDNTIRSHNFPAPKNPDDRGTLYCDGLGDKRLVRLIRKMREYNPIPNQQWFGPGYRNLAVSNIIEDPNFRDSSFSYFIQSADVCAYLLHQFLAPNSYMKKVSGQNYFHKLKPILCLKASPLDPHGIVRL